MRAPEQGPTPRSRMRTLNNFSVSRSLMGISDSARFQSSSAGGRPEPFRSVLRQHAIQQLVDGSASSNSSMCSPMRLSRGIAAARRRGCRRPHRRRRSLGYGTATWAVVRGQPPAQIPRAAPAEPDVMTEIRDGRIQQADLCPNRSAPLSEPGLAEVEGDRLSQSSSGRCLAARPPASEERRARVLSDDEPPVYPTEYPSCRQKQCLVNLYRGHTLPWDDDEKATELRTRVSEWTLQPSGVDTDSSESPRPRPRRRPPPSRRGPRASAAPRPQARARPPVRGGGGGASGAQACARGVRRRWWRDTPVSNAFKWVIYIREQLWRRPAL